MVQVKASFCFGEIPFERSSRSSGCSFYTHGVVNTRFGHNSSSAEPWHDFVIEAPHGGVAKIDEDPVLSGDSSAPYSLKECGA